MISEELYDYLVATASDNNEHLPTLRQYASEAEIVVELGTFHGKAAIALLMGTKGYVYSYDVMWRQPLVGVHKLGDGRWIFRLCDSRDPSVPHCDFMFIDSWHVGSHLEQELEAHSYKVKTRIALHDTETFGETGEDGSEGLMPALKRWLKRHPEWHIAKHYTNNNGLTVLERT